MGFLTDELGTFKFNQQLDLSKKSQTTVTKTTNQSFSDARSYSVIINSPNSSVAQTPRLTTDQKPSLSLSPAFTAPTGQSSGGSASDKSIFDKVLEGGSGLLVIGGIGVLAYFLVRK